MTLDNIQNIAWLARLAADESETAGYANDLADILALVEQMGDVDTSAVEPLAHPLDIPTPLRADQVTETDQREHFQETAPATAEGYYLVPKFME